MKKKNLAVFIAAAGTAVLLAACQSEGKGIVMKNKAVEGEEAAVGEMGQKQGYKHISAEEARKMMDELTGEIVLDVRTAEEYEESHIPGAVLIPNETIGDTQPEGLELDDTVLVYCRSGNRSRQAAEKLAAIGYRNVYEFGGIMDWPYETETGAYTQAAESGEEKTAEPALADGGMELTGEFKEFEAYNLDVETVNQDILKGYDLTMINIWGTFCSPCIREMPDLGEISREYQDKGFQLIGIPVDVGDDKALEKARQIVEKTGADYLHILPSQDLADIYLNQVTAVPETLFVDGTGTIIESVVGSRSRADWETLIDGLLEKVQADE